MNAIVFGGTGWVGHHMALALMEAGHDVTICSRGKSSTYDAEIPETLPRIRADKNDAEDMARVFEGSYDLVLDSVPTLEAITHIVAHAKGVKRYLHCSSTGGYAPLPVIPGDESLPYTGFRGGWMHKVDVDGKALAFHRDRGFPATVIRPSYITGPGQLPIDNLGNRRESFLGEIMKGEVMDSPDNGQALLQPVHIRDLARMFCLAIDTPSSIGEIYNACLEKAITLQRYLELTAAALGCEVQINFVPLEELLVKHADIADELNLRYLATHNCYDIRKPREELGYVPHCTTEEAIKETVRWSVKHLGL